jgi:L-lactate dehydrogenase complex protein LldG
MREDSRDRILGRLRCVPPPTAGADPDFDVMARKIHAPAERYPRMRRMMEAVHSEFLETSEAAWPEAVLRFVASEGIRHLAYGPATAAGMRLRGTWPDDGPRLVAYDRPVEDCKRELFEDVDAGFTTTRGGIAETGGLILWPSEQEPRLLSLVPPVHIALLDASRIHDSLWHAIRAEGWADRMPPNALLISGPSKTADIEQTLAYGVHGPKRLVVVVILTEQDA